MKTDLGVFLKHVFWSMHKVGRWGKYDAVEGREGGGYRIIELQKVLCFIINIIMIIVAFTRYSRTTINWFLNSSCPAMVSRRAVLVRSMSATARFISSIESVSCVRVCVCVRVCMCVVH